jgi:CDP-diacylglycerol--serine O-phosphatidyltransferase
MKIKNHIPNAITSGNLLCGCLAVVSAFHGNLIWSAYFVGIAAVLDFFDGFAARLLKVGGEMGKQLDSLADMVTFGVVPSVVMFQLLNSCTDGSWIPYIAFSIAVFSALRLAKFNIDTRQTTSFIGVPTPANAILICSLPLTFNEEGKLLILNSYFLIGLTLLMSYLLVAELPLFALKFKNFGWPDNKIRYSFLIISLILLILFQFIAIPFIIFLYIILSIISNIYNRNKTSHEI